MLWHLWLLLLPRFRSLFLWLPSGAGGRFYFVYACGFSSLPKIRWGLYWYWHMQLTRVNGVTSMSHQSYHQHNETRFLDVKKARAGDCSEYMQLYEERGTGRGELSYLAPLGSEKISAPYFKHCFFRGGGVYYPPGWVKHHASQSQDRNNKYFILYIEFCINNKI
jgi:hypothetical protein